jgi:hypothetical protein
VLQVPVLPPAAPPLPAPAAKLAGIPAAPAVPRGVSRELIGAAEVPDSPPRAPDTHLLGALQRRRQDLQNTPDSTLSTLDDSWTPPRGPQATSEATAAASEADLPAIPEEKAAGAPASPPANLRRVKRVDTVQLCKARMQLHQVVYDPPKPQQAPLSAPKEEGASDGETWSVDGSASKSGANSQRPSPGAVKRRLGF